MQILVRYIRQHCGNLWDLDCSNLGKVEPQASRYIYSIMESSLSQAEIGSRFLIGPTSWQFSRILFPQMWQVIMWSCQESSSIF